MRILGEISSKRKFGFTRHHITGVTIQVFFSRVPIKISKLINETDSIKGFCYVVIARKGVENPLKKSHFNFSKFGNFIEFSA